MNKLSVFQDHFAIDVNGAVLADTVNVAYCISGSAAGVASTLVTEAPLSGTPDTFVFGGAAFQLCVGMAAVADVCGQVHIVIVQGLEVSAQLVSLRSGRAHV